MLPFLRYPHSGILAAQRFRWPPECAGRRNSERIGSKSGKTDEDLEGPKNDPGLGFGLLSDCGKQDEFWRLGHTEMLSA